jgi:hypothetical protein
MSDSTGEVNGDSVQYSPWTDGKAQYWKNSMANPAGTFHGGQQFAWDQNLVVWDDTFFRTWVDALATTDAALAALIDNGAANEGFAYTYSDVTTLPRGFRVLVNSASPTGELANFGNMIAEWTGTEWRRKYSFDSTNDQVQVAVIMSAIVYEGNSFGTTPTWTALNTTAYGNDCFHPVTTVANADGCDLVNGIVRADMTNSTKFPDITKDGTTFSTNNQSAIKFTYTWSDIISASINAEDGEYYKRGGWANFRLPFPVTDYNSISDTVGGVYKPATLDLQNMHELSNGTEGITREINQKILEQLMV